jgi:methylthioribose-1-phosphate isomerase
LLSFLEKIDEETLEVMNNFLEKNVSTINKHKPTKINLYEDIMMIIEYKKEEELLKKDKKKGS